MDTSDFQKTTFNGVDHDQQFAFSLDFLLKETLELSEKINKEMSKTQSETSLSDFEKIIDIVENHELNEQTQEEDRQENKKDEKKPSPTEVSNTLYPDENDQDFLFDLVDQVHEKGLSVLEDKKWLSPTEITMTDSSEEIVAPMSPGLICRLDRGANTFCLRGFSTDNIYYQLKALKHEKEKLALLRAQSLNDEIFFFETRSFELAETIKEQVINRRFPILEDAVCNISDPGYSWWMNVEKGKFEIYFKSHTIGRADELVKLGPLGDSKIAMLRLNQAHALLRSSFPMDEFGCSDKSLVVSTLKPEHFSFISFQNIFLTGENNTHEENFPDNPVGRTLYYYFSEIAAIRKFWIEVEKKLS